MSDDEQATTGIAELDTDPGTPPEHDAAHPARRKRNANRAEREREEELAFWRGIFDSTVGRREMWRLLNAGHPFETRFMVSPGGTPDSLATWHAKGEQDFALRMYHAWMRLCPEQIIRMHQEHDPRFGAAPRAPRPKGD